LSRALEPGHQHDRRGLLGEFEPFLLAPQQLDELVPYHLDHLLDRVEAGHDVTTERARLDPLDELLRHFEVDVGIEQSIADLLRRLADVPLRAATLPSQIADDFLQLVGEAVEHYYCKLVSIRSRRGPPNEQSFKVASDPTRVKARCSIRSAPPT